MYGRSRRPPGLALVLVMLDTGARLAEVTGLDLSDIDWDLGVAVVRGKRGRCRSLPMGPRTLKSLDRTSGDSGLIPKPTPTCCGWDAPDRSPTQASDRWSRDSRQTGIAVITPINSGTRWPIPSSPRAAPKDLLQPARDLSMRQHRIHQQPAMRDTTRQPGTPPSMLRGVSWRG